MDGLLHVIKRFKSSSHVNYIAPWHNSSVEHLFEESFKAVRRFVTNQGTNEQRTSSSGSGRGFDIL